MLIVVGRRCLEYSGRYTGNVDNQPTNATPFSLIMHHNGDIAQQGEQQLCKLRVKSSNLFISTITGGVSAVSKTYMACNVVRLNALPP